VVVHLMIAGRLRWRGPGATVPARGGLAAFAFDHGTLLLTEAATKKRAALHIARGVETLSEHDRGGLEVLGADLPAFAEALRRESHTLKRALTDPKLFSGIGNAYSDEILHRARLSPVTLTGRRRARRWWPGSRRRWFVTVAGRRRRTMSRCCAWTVCELGVYGSADSISSLKLIVPASLSPSVVAISIA
jgi:hypothetical protein